MTRAVIMAAGEGSRWGNHTGVPKHLITPTDDGEVLITRLARQLQERGVTDVILTGPEEYRQHLPDHVEVRTPHTLGDDEVWLGTSKFVHTTPHWSREGRTIVFWGDCWLDDAVIDAVVGSTEDGLLCWCRYGRSPKTACRYGEIFAFSFFPDQHSRFTEAILATARAHRADQVNRSGGWEVIRAYAGARGSDIRTASRRVPQIRDVGHLGSGFSDDFDYPEDLDRWRQRWAQQ